MADLHPDFVPDAETTLAGLMKSYPQAGQVRIELYEPNAGDRSLGNSDTPGVIALNAYWFAEPRAKFDAAVIAGREAGSSRNLPRWHGGIGSLDHEFDRLLVHEYWHHLARALDEPAAQFCRKGHEAEQQDHALAVSGYAISDADEWGSETFAALRLGGAGSSQVADMQAFLAAHA